MDRAMVFGKYCLLERISVGGMAEVFRAKPLPAEASGNKMLALKRILPHLAEDDEFTTMFVDEAKLTVQLDHPNIVQTYELGNFQSSHYILMEYIAGADVLALQKYLRQNRRIMSVAQACYIAEKIGRGLHHAHTACDEQGRPIDIIHRDVSPQNIRLTYDGRVKLIDFGIAKAAVQRTQTQVGVLKGKFGYMSPEQVHDAGMDQRADVFALGTTLWEMLTNRRLFNGENEFETLQLVRNLEVEPPSDKNPHVPPRVDEIVMRALAEDPARRYQTAEALADALTDFRTEIDEPYSQEHLAGWMAETFSEELAEEQRKRKLFAQIEQPEDVKWFNRKYVDEAAAESRTTVSEPQTGEETQPAREIWDPEFAPEEDDAVDHEQFASDHTVVAAGGFDPADFGDEDDEVVALVDDLSPPPGEETAPGTRVHVGGDSGRTLRLIGAVAAVAVVLLVTAGVSYMAFGAAANQSPAEASLVITVVPSPKSPGAIRVDGKSEESKMPVTLPELEPGEHLVEVDYPGYEPTSRRIELTAGELRTLSLELEPVGGR